MCEDQVGWDSQNAVGIRDAGHRRRSRRDHVGKKPIGEVWGLPPSRWEIVKMPGRIFGSRHCRHSRHDEIRQDRKEFLIGEPVEETRPIIVDSPGGVVDTSR